MTEASGTRAAELLLARGMNDMLRLGKIRILWDIIGTRMMKSVVISRFKATGFCGTVLCLAGSDRLCLAFVNHFHGLQSNHPLFHAITEKGEFVHRQAPTPFTVYISHLPVAVNRLGFPIAQTICSFTDLLIPDTLYLSGYFPN